MISYAYLVFFSNADRDIEVSPNKKIPQTSCLSIMQKYTLMPGKMIQTCRKVVEFIHKGQIPASSVKSAKDILSRVHEQSIMEADRTGGMLILYDYLKACFAYYLAYSSRTVQTSVLNPSVSEKSIGQINEERSNKSSRNATPVKFRPRANDSKSLLHSQNSVISIAESTKSFHIQDTFEQALERRFRDFLKNNDLGRCDSLVGRVELIDSFERDVRDFVRNKFLARVIDDQQFKAEMRSCLEEE
jgi:hypothetical protein